MRELFEKIAAASDRAPGTTLVVGAGNGAELPLLRGLGSRRLVLAEAHPQVAAELAARAHAAEGEEVWSLAISPAAAEQVDLRVVSNLRYSSLREPDQLFTHAPNLRQAASVRVPARSLTDAILSAVTDRAANNVLILDAPGLGVELLDSAETELIRRFEWLIVHASAIPDLYRDEPIHQRATERLAEIGFDRVAEDGDALYPEVVTLYRRSEHRIEVTTQAALIASLRQELDQAREAGVWRARQQQAQLDALRTERDEAGRERANLARQLDDLRQQLSQAGAERDGLLSEKKALVGQRERETQRANRLATELGEQHRMLQSAIAERDELKQRLDAQQAESDTTRDRSEALRKQLHMLASARDECERTAADQRQRAQRLQTDLEAARVDNRELTEAKQRLRRTQAEAEERLSALQARVEELERERASLVADRQRLQEARDAAAETAGTLQTELEALRRECRRLEEEKRVADEAFEQQAKRGAGELIANLDRAEQKLSARQQRIDQLEYELTESSSRQRLLAEELVKAEAQLDLVKDLLLREQTL
jgi:DNA repair exonuclease SbcCD ATPase subunit